MDDKTRTIIDHNLPISKLRGVPSAVRSKLRSRRITTCGQLLAAATTTGARAALTKATGIDGAVLLALVQRADMARIKGVGTVFGLMLEEIGIVDVERLARQEPVQLHDALRRYNLNERLARRSPTLDEVAAWIAEARALPITVSYTTASEHAC